LQIAAAVIAPPSCVAPSSTGVVCPPTSPLCVPILVLECKTIVALASSAIETACVEAALVVVSLVIVSIVEVSSVEVVAVAVVEAVGVPIVVAAASTVVVVSTKEDP